MGLTLVFPNSSQSTFVTGVATNEIIGIWKLIHRAKIRTKIVVKAIVQSILRIVGVNTLRSVLFRNPACDKFTTSSRIVFLYVTVSVFYVLYRNLSNCL